VAAVTIPNSPETLVQRLVGVGERKLNDDLRPAFLDAGPAAVSALIDVLRDDALALETAPGGGYAPVHATELLATLRPTEAVEPMLRVLREGDTQSILHDAVVRHLPAWGEAALEPTLRALANELENSAKHSLLAVLAGLGVRDERIYAALLDELRDDVGWGAGHLGDYGDERAIEHLERAAAALEPGGEGEFLGTSQDLIEVEAAIEALGGEPSTALRAKLATIERLRDAFFGGFEQGAEPRAAAPGESARAKPAKVGRNDPCACGSGKKYKKCCWVKDQAAK
jgi:hypothetical protein